MDTERRGPPIVEAIVKMAAGLRIDVVAEGVETIEQADSLRRLGCLHAQGYYYARPMAPGDVAGLFEHSLPFDGLRQGAAAGAGRARRSAASRGGGAA